jgi:hypothetical protein
LTIDVAPAITQEPSAATRCVGQGVTFSVTASGTAPLAYQWRRDGVDLVDGAGISGATTATLSIAAVAPAHAGSYDCVVTNACGSATSSAAALTIDVAPAITQEPSAATRCAGQGVTFSITATGTAPLAYQWRRNGVDLADGAGISGATTATLSIAAVAPAHAGSYDCVVTNACGSTTSSAAALTIDTAPAITQEPAAATRCGGQTVSFTVAATGTAPLAYQWRHDGQPITIDGRISGAATPTLTISSLDPVDAGLYDCVVSNACGSATSSAAALTIDVAPAITQGPAGATRCAGQAASFSITATGTAPLAYQWRRDGVSLADGAGISGAMTASLSIAAVSPAHAGSYDCVVTNACGSATSSAAALAVHTAPTIVSGPAPATRCTGQAAVLTVSAEGTSPLAYQWRRDGVPLSDGGGYSGAATATLTIVSTVAGNLGSFDCVVTNACGAATSDAAAVQYNAPPTITEQPAGHKRCIGQPEVMVVAAAGLEPMTYQWRRDGVDLVNGGTISGATTPILTISAVALSDEGAYTCVVTNACGSATTSPALLTVSAAPTILSHPSPLARCAGQSASFTVSATGPAPLTYQWRRNGVNLANIPGVVSGATSPTLNLVSVGAGDAGSYDCVVSNSCGAGTASDAAALTVNVPPSITQHPAAQSPCSGSNVSFTVGAAGSAPLAYQWRRDGLNLADGGRISGALTATLTIAAAEAGDDGLYDCVVSNACGSVASSAAALAVAPGPTIAQEPQDLDLNAGQTATFTVAASGPGPFTYQWYRDGDPLADGGSIGGATTDTLTITPARRDDSGGYSVTVTGSCGVATSRTAVLAVYCAADLNRNGVVEPSDIAQFVNTWFADLSDGTFHADFDGNGLVEPADVAAFVALWFATLSAGC